MKKILLSGFVVVAFVAYAIHQKAESTQAVNLLTSSNNTLSSPTARPAATETTTPTMMDSNSIDMGMGGNGHGSGMMMQTYQDGSYTGDVADAFYGLVQVKVTISSGQISNVEFLQYPNDRSTSRQISSYAMPRLKSEAIAAQSADVNMISGATQTSRAFIESLTSALNKAKS